eukprot:m.113817 g.113817  ORF g.113817 m.113817 type:complete len:57 (+) comp13525_c0_seq1:188-358(+)
MHDTSCMSFDSLKHRLMLRKAAATLCKSVLNELGFIEAACIQARKTYESYKVSAST